MSNNINDDYIGRLKINDANISVALYCNNKQSTTDALDSANYWKNGSGYIIADHNNQEFRTLSNVKVGTVAIIEFKDGTIKEYECVKTLNGHNTGNDLTDENYNSLYSKADILMYTCRDCWQNVTIRLFDEVKNIMQETTKNDDNLDPIISFDELAQIAGEEAKKAVEKVLRERLGDCFAG